MPKPDNLFIIIVALIALYLVFPYVPIFQKPSIVMTSDAYGSRLESVDAMGNKIVCRADVMPGGAIVSRCY